MSVYVRAQKDYKGSEDLQDHKACQALRLALNK